ncbi:MAG: hypothetical protein IJU23_00670 [Proteobacteria bacterium]|nr:hypothetical protein [Pseudomonadota bacterium]
MKINILFSLICILSAVLFCACDLDILGEEQAVDGNMQPGTDGYWCWKVIITKGGVSTTESWWYTEDGIELSTQMYSEESGGTEEYSYSKLPNIDKDGCPDVYHTPPGKNGYWCWEVIITKESISTTEYWWMSEDWIELETQRQSEESGGTEEYSYSKLHDRYKDDCLIIH